MKKKSKSETIAYDICLSLQKAGYIAYFAGGSVRDQYLGVTPKDYDIATSALPDQIEELFTKTISVGKSFGVISVIKDKIQTDVATFRAESCYSDNRHPDAIKFCDAEEDAIRRDFTINALFYDPITEKIIDYVDGLIDLDACIIRAIGNPYDRFREDHLRLLRAIRFSHVLGFEIEKDTFQAIKKEASLINSVSIERIENEFTRILTESRKPGDALHTLQTVGLLPIIIPEISRLIGIQQPYDYHPEGDVYTHTRMMLNQIEEVYDNAVFTKQEIAYAVLLHDIAKPDTYSFQNNKDSIDKQIRFLNHETKGAIQADEILKRLKISKKQRTRIVNVIKNHMIPFQSKNMRAAKLRRMMGDSSFPLLLELHRLDCMCSSDASGSYTYLQEVYNSYKEEPILPEPWINGSDLLAMGMMDGPKLGRILALAYDRQLARKEPDRDALLNWLKKHQK